MGGLHRDAGRFRMRDRGEFRRHFRRMGPDLRVLADDGHIAGGLGGGGFAIRKPRSRARLQAWSRKIRLAAPFHRGSDGGKCRPMFAIGQRAVDRVGERVHGDIGIRMALQPAVEGNVDAAEGDMGARAEPVHVVAVAGADISHRSSEQGLGAGEIAGPWCILRFASSPERMATSSPAARAYFHIIGPRRPLERGERRGSGPAGSPGVSAPGRARRGAPCR